MLLGTKPLMTPSGIDLLSCLLLSFAGRSSRAASGYKKKRKDYAVKRGKLRLNMSFS